MNQQPIQLSFDEVKMMLGEKDIIIFRLHQQIQKLQNELEGAVQIINELKAPNGGQRNLSSGIKDSTE